MIAPLTSPHVPCRNCGEAFAPVRTSCCGRRSALNCLTIVEPAGVAVQSQSACAFEFLTFVRSAVKSGVPGEKIVVSTTCRPYLLASFATCAGPSRPKPPLSPISHTRLIFSFRRYAASLYAYSRAVGLATYTNGFGGSTSVVGGESATNGTPA